MGKKKSADPDAPMPNLRDQGGLAAVARMVQQQRELEMSVPAQGVKIANPPAFQPGFLDRKPAKKDKKEKKDKKDKKEKKDKKDKKEKKDKDDKDDGRKKKEKRKPAETEEPPAAAADKKAKAKEAPKTMPRNPSALNPDSSDDDEDRLPDPNKVKMPHILPDDSDAEPSSDSDPDALVGGMKFDEAEDEKLIEIGEKWAAGIAGDVRARHKRLLADAEKLDRTCTKTRKTYNEFLTLDMVKESIYGEDGTNHGDCGERLFIRCGRVAGRATELCKKVIRWSHVLMGSRADASVTDLAQTLAEDLRMKEHAIGTLIGYNRLYDQVTKHNAVVWGRARNAVETRETEHAKTHNEPLPDHSKVPRSKKHWVDELSHPLEIPSDESDSEETKEKRRKGIVEKDGISFEEYYGNAMINAFGDELAEWQKEDGGKTDVSLIMRALQSGADVIPTLQKELMMQYESLGDLKELKSGGADFVNRNQVSEAVDEVEDMDADGGDADGGSGSELSGLGSDDERLAKKKRKAYVEDEEAEILKSMGAGSTYSYSGDSDNVEDESGDESDKVEDESGSESDGGDSGSEESDEDKSDPDDAVDYAVTPMAH